MNNTIPMTTNEKMAFFTSLQNVKNINEFIDELVKKGLKFEEPKIGVLIGGRPEESYTYCNGKYKIKLNGKLFDIIVKQLPNRKVIELNRWEGRYDNMSITLSSGDINSISWWWGSVGYRSLYYHNNNIISESYTVHDSKSLSIVSIDAQYGSIHYASKYIYSDNESIKLNGLHRPGDVLRYVKKRYWDNE